MEKKVVADGELKRLVNMLYLRAAAPAADPEQTRRLFAGHCMAGRAQASRTC